MNWLTIHRECPQAFAKWFRHLEFTEESGLTPARLAAIANSCEFPFWDIGLRDLYDFFDGEGIVLALHWDDHQRAFSFTYWPLAHDEPWTSPPQGAYATRALAEVALFAQGFRCLETKLTPLYSADPQYA